MFGKDYDEEIADLRADIKDMLSLIKYLQTANLARSAKIRDIESLLRDEGYYYKKSGWTKIEGWE